MLGQEDGHGRGDVDGVDLVLADDAQELLRVELRHRDDRRAVVQAVVHHHGHAVDVEERQHGQQAVLRGDVEDRLDLAQVRHQVAVSEDHTLRQARGARRVRQHRGVLRTDLDRGRRTAGSGDVGQRGAALHRVEGDDRVVRDAELGGGRAGAVQERRDGDDRAGTGVAELVHQLRRRVQRVGAGHDGVGAQHAVEGGHPVRVVGREQRHDVALADATGREPGGDLVDEAVELVEGEGGTAGAVDEGGLVRAVSEVGEEELVDRGIRDLDIGVRTAEGHRARAPLRTAGRGRPATSIRSPIECAQNTRTG